MDVSKMERITPATLDAGQIAVETVPTRDFPAVKGRRESRFQVVIKQSVLNDLYQHENSTTKVEVCGVVVGNLYRDEAAPFLYVEASIRGEKATNQAAQVTFTSETWTHIHEEMEKCHGDRRIVGWYHTHPGFGIFLSPMDLFIHENFFSAAEQIAYVYDPLSGKDGVFVWRDGKPVKDVALIEEDIEEPKLRPGFQEMDQAAVRPVTELLEQLKVLKRRRKWPLILLILLALLAVVAVLWAIAGEGIFNLFHGD